MAVSSLDTPSRLKGIETYSNKEDNALSLSFGYTFPFEGNWNQTPITPLPPYSLWIHLPVWRELKLIEAVTVEPPVDFGYTFPFEGNWNSIVVGYLQFLFNALDTPSRLKGIETFNTFMPVDDSRNITLDTPSRLKGIETFGSSTPCCRMCSSTLDTPSRLKGIETFRSGFGQCSAFYFGYTFPFERNWNKKHRTFCTLCT